jgi:hypothetical protein
MSKFFRSSFILPVVAFYLYLSGSATFLGQWDSYDYLKQIVSHQLSALGFGRPAFLGYNILIWESAKRAFHLDPLKVEAVIMIGTVLLGAIGVLLFKQLAQQFLSPPAARMAVLAFAISPMYAVYSGFIMTEVPMLVALIAAALILWKPPSRQRVWCDIGSGLLFGIAVGIREQALTLGAAYLWLLCCRPDGGRSRIGSMISFGTAAAASVLAPVLAFYLMDPSGFIDHTKTWLRAIPMGHIQVWNNIQASLLWMLAICPASWLALAYAGVHLRKKSVPEFQKEANSGLSIPNGAWGFICSIVLPILCLWRDADVQIHPRYLLIAFPGSVIFCAYIYSRWAASKKGALIWAATHVFIFGIALVALHPYFQNQADKMQSARAIRDAVPGRALLIAGNYSPMLDYYRGIGVRPQWQILWSGWDWTPSAAEDSIRKAWADRIPVYLSKDPLGWRYFETEYLHFHLFLQNHNQEHITSKFYRIYPE